MNRTRIAFPGLAAFLCVMVSAAAGEHWPQWRGPDLNGCSDAKGLPTTWSETENILWKTPLPSWSGATPIIWGDRIFVASPDAADGAKLLLICLSKRDGVVLWQRETGRGRELQGKENSSSPSPVTDGHHVWTLTSSGTVTAFDMDGGQVWQRNLCDDYGPFGHKFRYGASPLLFDDKVIIPVLHGFNTEAPSYVVALDAKTGAPVWRVERPSGETAESKDAYTTPTLLHHGGTTQVIVSGGGRVSGHDPATGAEVWSAGDLNPEDSTIYRIITSPVASDGMVYAPSRKKPILAVRAGGAGDVSASHIVWRWDRPHGPDVPSPACDGDLFYMVDDGGSITCLDAKTGNVAWGPERTGRGMVSASPLVADGKVYITNEEAVTTVLKAGRKYKVLATNRLAGANTLSSIAVSGSRLFLRTAENLYCIGAPAE